MRLSRRSRSKSAVSRLKDKSRIEIRGKARCDGKQILTYLRPMKLPVGLLINFGASTLKEGLIAASKPVLECLCRGRLRVNRNDRLICGIASRYGSDPVENLMPF